MARLFINYKRQDQAYAFAIRQWLIDHQGWVAKDIFVDQVNLVAGDVWEKTLLTEAKAAEAMLFLASDASIDQRSFCCRELKVASGHIITVTLKGLSNHDPRLLRILPERAKFRQIVALDQQPVEGFDYVSPVDNKLGSIALNRIQIASICNTLHDLGMGPDNFIAENREGHVISRISRRAWQPKEGMFDDVVLTCCNHAFDVALAHRSSEIRLEHLLHSMTRVEGADKVLKAHGINVAGLRRESAAIIAGELPVSVASYADGPHPSNDLGQVLQTASAIASRRNAQGKLDDVIGALFDMPSGTPGLSLLNRHRTMRETAAGSLGGGSPILVDDVVLACCNQAFDVALAHRSNEVRLEHLLHSMTRVEGADKVLEAHGIDVAGLRRESATIIARELLAGTAPVPGRPRRSDELEQVLRASSAFAFRQDRLVNVDDVLAALFEMPSDIPSIVILNRYSRRLASSDLNTDLDSSLLHPRPPNTGVDMTQNAPPEENLGKPVHDYRSQPTLRMRSVGALRSISRFVTAWISPTTSIGRAGLGCVVALAPIVFAGWLYIIASSDARKLNAFSYGAPRIAGLIPHPIGRPALAHAGPIAAIAISEHGRFAATAGWDGSLRVWNAKSGALLRTFDSHNGVKGVAYWIGILELGDGFVAARCRGEDSQEQLFEALVDPAVSLPPGWSNRHRVSAAIPGDRGLSRFADFFLPRSTIAGLLTTRTGIVVGSADYAKPEGIRVLSGVGGTWTDFVNGTNVSKLPSYDLPAQAADKVSAFTLKTDTFETSLRARVILSSLPIAMSGPGVYGLADGNLLIEDQLIKLPFHSQIMQVTANQSFVIAISRSGEVAYIGQPTRSVLPYASILDLVMTEGQMRTEASAPPGQISPSDIKTFKAVCPACKASWLAANSSLLIVGGDLGDVQVWDVSTKKLFAKLAHGSGVSHVFLTPDARRAITVGDEGAIKLWDLPTEVSSVTQSVPAAIIRGHGDVIAHAALSHDGKTLLTASWDGQALVSDIFAPHISHGLDPSPYVRDLAMPVLASLWNKFNLKAPYHAGGPDVDPNTVTTRDAREITRAIQHELDARGYGIGKADGMSAPLTAAAILAYEFDHDLPLTADASEDLLRTLVLGSEKKSGDKEKPVKAPSPKAVQLVKSVQESLSAIGYGPVTDDGYLGAVTVRAIRQFERDQGLVETGRISAPMVERLTNFGPKRVRQPR